MVLQEQEENRIVSQPRAFSSERLPDKYDGITSDYDICVNSPLILASLIELVGMGYLIDAIGEVKDFIKDAAKKFRYL